MKQPILRGGKLLGGPSPQTLAPVCKDTDARCCPQYTKVLRLEHECRPRSHAQVLPFEDLLCSGGASQTTTDS